METRYQILRTIYELVKDDPQPATCICRPRQLILRSLLDWSIISKDLTILEDEGLISTKQSDTLHILITTAGIDKVRSIIEVSEEK